MEPIILTVAIAVSSLTFASFVILYLVLCELKEHLAERRKRNIAREERMEKEQIKKQIKKEAEATRKEFLARLYAKRNK